MIIIPSSVLCSVINCTSIPKGKTIAHFISRSQTMWERGKNRSEISWLVTPCLKSSAPATRQHLLFKFTQNKVNGSYQVKNNENRCYEGALQYWSQRNCSLNPCFWYVVWHTGLYTSYLGHFMCPCNFCVPVMTKETMELKIQVSRLSSVLIYSSLLSYLSS